MWLTLAEQHVRRRDINWKEWEKICFNEWATPDDEGLGDQIIKDLHRTGCSLFCGPDAAVNQALLKRVLLGYARWNKSVGYCQGFNMLAAIILEVMDKQESDALKVMIYLIEGVLPESYFANNLRGLSVDMAVFRELMRLHLPELSRHLDMLQQEAADQATGACYEPPLTNVFTMQWFLTLFSNCLPRDGVMRVWDLTFLQGNEMLLRTALAIWGRLAPRILEVPSADEFYSVMGDLTREMLVQELMDANQLVQTLNGMAPFPFPGLATLRDRYTYNITPWTQSVSTVARKGLKIFLDDEEEEEKTDHDDVHQKMAVATAFGLADFFKKSMDGISRDMFIERDRAGDMRSMQGEQLSTIHESQDGRCSPIQTTTMRPNLDISALKKQYTKLRERQRQAHIILTASNIRRKSIDEVNRLQPFQKTNQLTMKHLLRGKKALTTKTKRVVAQGVIPPLTTKKKVERKLSDSTGLKSWNGNVEKSPKFPHKTACSNRKAKPPLLPAENATISASRKAVSECSTVESSKTPLPPETLHWKDTPKRARRASLPYGVKFLEIATAPPLPEIKDVDSDEGSSSSTELCDEDLAVLSEEENTPPLGPQRPSSTSPRLENREKDTLEERFDKFLEDSRTTNLPKEEAKEDRANLVDDVIVDKVLLDAETTAKTEPSHISRELEVPCVLPIPEISGPFLDKENLSSSTRTSSLSSPTKWKWSFSEIENPNLIQPISPILRLRNFRSDEGLGNKNASYLLSPNTPNSEDTDPVGNFEGSQHKSNIFAYLFEITDVTKLSNVNSEEPSPNDDQRSKENSLSLEEVQGSKMLEKILNSSQYSGLLEESLNPYRASPVSRESASFQTLPQTGIPVSTPCFASLQMSGASILSAGNRYLDDKDSELSIMDDIAQPSRLSEDVNLGLSNGCGVCSEIGEKHEVKCPTLPKESKVSQGAHKSLFPNEIKNYNSESYSLNIAPILRNMTTNGEQEDKEKLKGDEKLPFFLIKTAEKVEPFSVDESSSVNMPQKEDREDLKTFLVDHKGPLIVSNENLTQSHLETHKASPVLEDLNQQNSVFETVENTSSLTTSLESKMQSSKGGHKSYERGTNCALPAVVPSVSLYETEEIDQKRKRVDTFPTPSSELSLKTSPTHAGTREYNDEPANLSNEQSSKPENVELKFHSLSKYFKISDMQRGSTEKKSLSDSIVLRPQEQVDSGDVFDDNATEVVRRKLWAGVKSLSLDAKILIATNKSNRCYLDFSAASLPILDESPLGENGDEAKKEIATKPNSQSGPTTQKKINKRRKSEAALQLMKENTKIIDQILNQRYEEGEENEALLISQMELKRDSPLLLKRKSFSDQNISESLAADGDKDKLGARLEFKERVTTGKKETQEFLEMKRDVKKSNSDSGIPRSEQNFNQGEPHEATPQNSANSVSSVPFVSTKQSLLVLKKDRAQYQDIKKITQNKSMKNYSKDRIIQEVLHSPKIVPFSKLSKLSPKTLSSTSSSTLIENTVACDFTKILSNEVTKTHTSFYQTGSECPSSKLDNLIARSTHDNIHPSLFYPFPTKPLSRPHKEAVLKLGLYSSSKSSGESSRKTSGDSSS